MLSRLGIAIAFLVSLVLLPASSRADRVRIEGLLSLQVGPVGGIDPLEVPGSSFAEVSWNGSGTPESIRFDAGMFQTDRISQVVHEAGAAPINGLVISGSSGEGVFGNTIGTMGFEGSLLICLFAYSGTLPCPVSEIDVPLGDGQSGMGLGGDFLEASDPQSGIEVALLGSTWTTGEIAALDGPVGGPFSETPHHGQPFQDGRAVFVSALEVTTNLATTGQKPTFAQLELQIVPEPKTWMLVGLALLAFVWTRRSPTRVSSRALLVAALACGVAGSTARADSMGYVGSLRLNVDEETTISVTGSGLAEVQRDAAGELIGFDLPPGAFQAEGVAVRVDGPFPLAGFVLEAKTTGGQFDAFGGSMGVDGVVTACLFSFEGGLPCPLASIEADLMEGSSGVGIGGVPINTSNEFGGIVVTLQGAPWTTGAVEINLESGGTLSLAGEPLTDGNGRYITPVDIRTNLNGDVSQLVGFAELDVALVPEPSAMALLGVALLGLFRQGRKR